MKLKQILTIFGLVLLSFAGNNLQAQVRFSSATPNLEMVAKRMSVENGVATIVGTITWYGKIDAKEFTLNRREIKFIDDEGDFYTFENIQIDMGNVTVLTPGSVFGSGIDLPAGIPVKFRITIRGLNEYATAFSLIEIPYFGNPTAKFQGDKFSFRNLQFPAAQ